MPTTFNPRSTSLGYGNREDMSYSKNLKPSPNHYSFHSEFKQLKKHGISYGLGRKVLFQEI
jgi:hypothetical protein